MRLTLRLCDVCPGLLDLADRPDRETWWLRRYEAACIDGFHARLLTTASDPAVPGQANGKSKGKGRALPRLTEVHRLTNRSHTASASRSSA
ncbi:MULTISPECIES: hypothetical protein [unclassified Kitasatospora]|uniref:hypothetical protein n=1 Tax=unclassified Kitasatospora TaxID=2633591 RepID=UPI002474FD38|nr:hypothetical protein [Kitasatospora sp. MAA19]MDH6710181.1 hypothetical protein [Kitasatospora sp. MAA19]